MRRRVLTIKPLLTVDDVVDAATENLELDLDRKCEVSPVEGDGLN